MLIEFTLGDMAVGLSPEGSGYCLMPVVRTHTGGHTIGIAKKNHTQTAARVWRCCFTMFAGGPGGWGKNCQSIHRLFEIPGVDKQSLLVVWIVGGIYNSLKRSRLRRLFPLFTTEETVQQHLDLCAC